MSEPVYDITDDVKRDVLAATDLVQLIGATTSLKKAGRSWKGGGRGADAAGGATVAPRPPAPPNVCLMPRAAG